MSERVRSRHGDARLGDGVGDGDGDGVDAGRGLPAELSGPSSAAISRSPRTGTGCNGGVRSERRRTADRSSGASWMLIHKADALLDEAIGHREPRDRFRCAYLAALRGAGAILASGVAGGGSRRKRTGNAWVLLEAAAPAFGAWARYFAGWSATRAAIETGMSAEITDADSDAFFAEVGRFLTAVEDVVGQDSGAHLAAS